MNSSSSSGLLDGGDGRSAEATEITPIVRESVESEPAGVESTSVVGGVPSYGATARLAAIQISQANKDAADDFSEIVVVNSADDNISSAPSKKSKGKEKGKKGKLPSPQKVLSDQLKLDMASERTFFKYFWTGLHLGAIGTFVFVSFDADLSSRLRFWVIAFIWTIAFGIVLFGLYAYYRRRSAMQQGSIEQIPSFIREHSPILVVLSLCLSVGAVIALAVLSGEAPHKGHNPLIPGA